MKKLFTLKNNKKIGTVLDFINIDDIDLNVFALSKRYTR